MRLYASNLATNSVAALAAAARLAHPGKAARCPSSRASARIFLFNYPQYLGGMTVIDANDWSRYHGLQGKSALLQPRDSYLFAYTFAKSMDTRSFDPVFTVVGTGNAQSASSTPFNINDRGLNYARPTSTVVTW